MTELDNRSVGASDIYIYIYLDLHSLHKFVPLGCFVAFFVRGNGHKFGFEHVWLLRRLLSSHVVCCVDTCGNIPGKRAQIPAKRVQIPAKRAQIQIM